MNISGIIKSFAPRPRRKLQLRSVMTLLIFVAAYGCLCWVLTASDTVMFTKLWAFWFMIFTPWVWWMSVAGYSGLTGWRGELALIIRLALIGTFVFVLAEPRSVRKSDSLSVVFALDTSMSIDNETRDEALNYITEIVADKPEKDEAGLVTFGRNSTVELAPSQSFPFEGSVTIEVDRDGTNLERALSLAGAMLPTDKQGRIVLISDGVETEGSITRVVDELKARDIAVDVLPIEYKHEHEVLIERLELPKFVKTGETYNAVVIVSSLQAGTGELYLQENDQTIFKDTVEFGAGKSRFVVPIHLRQAGYYEYTATIELPEGKDGWKRNNKAISYLYLKGEGRVLLVTAAGGDPRDWQPLESALKGAKRIIETRSAYEFPVDPLSLLPYDCIVFVNVGADAFVAMQLMALKQAVQHQGAGFLMVGGNESFGPGGYHNTPVEEILPVSVDVNQKKVLPKGALAIVLHTCEFGSGNTWGKNITKQAIKVLGAKDEVGVLMYYQGQAKWLFDLTPAAQYEQMVKLINNSNAGDMPDFASTMRMGLTSLSVNDASVKHMIIISDGDPQPPSPKLLQSFIDEGITVSTVAISPHGNDTRVMQMIAKVTEGRFYFPQDPKTLPSIFIKEAKTLKRSMIQNIKFVPQHSFPSPVMKGIETMPPLYGYVITTPKARARVILKTPETDDVEPVLSTWRFGVGKTAAFTSDLSANWGKDWLGWESYQPFVKQLFEDISRVNKQGSLRMQSFRAGGEGVVIVEDFDPDASFLTLHGVVSLPDGEEIDIALEQTGPRRYEGRFDLTGEGRYQVMAMSLDSGREQRIHGGFVVPYSLEYLRFRSNPIVLDAIREKTNGRKLDATETGQEIYDVERIESKTSQPVFDWYLILLLCLLPMDIAVRRVQIDMEVICGLLGMSRTHTPSDETFSQLLHRKKRVDSSLKDENGRARRKVVKPAALKPEAYETEGDAKTKTEVTRTTMEAGDGDDESTTSMLLKRMQEHRDDKQED